MHSLILAFPASLILPLTFQFTNLLTHTLNDIHSSLSPSFPLTFFVTLSLIQLFIQPPTHSLILLLTCTLSCISHSLTPLLSHSFSLIRLLTFSHSYSFSITSSIIFSATHHSYRLACSLFLSCTFSLLVSHSPIHFLSVAKSLFSLLLQTILTPSLTQPPSLRYSLASHSPTHSLSSCINLAVLSTHYINITRAMMLRWSW